MRSNGRNHLILASAFVLLLVAPACLADLMCYVCDNCDKVTKDTPLLACNEDFFNQGGSTEASTVTTTAASTSISTTEEDTSSSSTETTTTTTTAATVETTDVSAPPSTTGEPVVTTTTPEESTTEQATESTESTEAPMPTPATVGPPETTTGMPTPPAEDFLRQQNMTRLLPSFDIAMPASVSASESASTELNVRQRRGVIDTSVSYHCYTVQKTMNNTAVTERGCSRVETQQSVCQELQLENSNMQLANCDPCTMNACNGATSVLQSSLLATLMVAVVAAALQRN